MPTRQQSAFRMIAAIALGFALVLLLAIHSPNQAGIGLFCLLLLPVFLFGKIDVLQSLGRVSQTGEAAICPVPSLPSRFQRPPPYAFVEILLS